MDNIPALRMVSQGLAYPNTNDVAMIVSKLGAMQAQDYQGGLWSIGIRMREPSLETVEQAISNYQIVRTWPMRGTLHFVSGQDIRWIVALLGPRAIALAASRRKQLELTEDVIGQARSIVVRRLVNTNGVTRSELCNELDAYGIRSSNQRGIHLLHYFSEQGLLCFGPHQGKEPAFVLLDEHVSRASPKTREESLAELAKRFFNSHGPATIKDFAGWAYLTMADARFGLHEVRQSLVEETIDGNTYYFNAQTSPDSLPSLLLPGFDEYVLGYKDRRAILQEDYMDHVVPGNNGMFLATIIIRGKVVGLWKKAVNKKGVRIYPILFSKKSIVSMDDINTAAKRYTDFLNTAAPTISAITYL